LDAKILTETLAQEVEAGAAVEVLAVDELGNGTQIAERCFDYRAAARRIVWHAHHCASSSGPGKAPASVRCDRAQCLGDACSAPLEAEDSQLGLFDIPVYAGESQSSITAAAVRRIAVTLATDRPSAVRALAESLAREADLDVRLETVRGIDDLRSNMRGHRTRVLLIDEAVTRRIGTSAVRAIRRAIPGVRIILLADEMPVAELDAILQNRFDGLLLTRCPDHVSARAVRAVDRGELWLPRSLLSRTIAELMGAPAFDAPLEPPGGDGGSMPLLTGRETDIVHLLRCGFTNKEIGRRLGIMEDTVKKHLQNIFAKLGVHRRSLVMLRSPQSALPGTPRAELHPPR
jgi:DNA-binding NarL/FixJ family response regulator